MLNSQVSPSPAINSLWIAGILILHGLQVSAQLDKPRDVSAKFPITFDSLDDLPVRTLGAEHFASIATGYEKSLFDESLQQHLLKKEGSSELGDLFVGPEITLPFSGLPKVRSERGVLCLDLSLARDFYGSKHHLKMGMDYLNTLVLSINSDESYYSIGTKGLVNDPSAMVCRMPEKLGVPTIRLDLSDEGFHTFCVNVGSGVPLQISPGLFDDLVFKKRIQNVNSDVRAELPGTPKTAYRIGILDKVKIGSLELRNIEVHEHLKGQPNFVGVGLLRHFNVDLDFRAEQAVFVKSRYFGNFPTTNLAGVTFTKSQEGTRVRSFYQKSASEEAGLKLGEIIESFDGIPSVSLPLSLIREKLTQDGKTLHLGVTRGSSHVVVQLKLKRPPVPFSRTDALRTVRAIPE